MAGDKSRPSGSGSRVVQLVACMVAMMAIANLQYSWTLFTLPLSRELGVKLSAIQLAFTLFILAETWLVPAEGYLIDKLGARWVASPGAVLVAAGWIGSGLAPTVGWLYVAYTVAGVGGGAVYGACVGTALKWFPDRRGLAAGLVAGSYGFGTALTILPIKAMIEGSGYRLAFVVWGIIQGVLVMAAAQVMKSPPAGYRPAGWSPETSRLVQAAVSSTPLQMVKTLTFWVMYAMMTMVAFGGLMVTAQLSPMATSYGLNKHVLLFGMTALALALILDRILNGITRPFWGWVSDHIGRYNAMAIAFTLEAAGILALLRLVDRPVWFVVLSGLVFFAWGEIYSLFPAAIGDFFGPDYATTNYGIQYTAKGTASIFAGWGAAWLVETTGSWIPVLWVAVACDLVAASLAFFWLRPLAKALTARRSAPSAGPLAAPAPSLATARD